MNSFKLPIVALSYLFVVGCASSPSEEVSMIKDANEKMVAECQYLGDVQGSSGFGGLMASQGIINSKIEAREAAAKLNATHIVWRTVSGGYVPHADGSAYSCSNKTDHS